jgi:hypothetical protein
VLRTSGRITGCSWRAKKAPIGIIRYTDDEQIEIPLLGAKRPRWFGKPKSPADGS